MQRRSWTKHRTLHSPIGQSRTCGSHAWAWAGPANMGKLARTSRPESSPHKGFVGTFLRRFPARVLSALSDPLHACNKSVNESRNTSPSQTLSPMISGSGQGMASPPGRGVPRDCARGDTSSYWDIIGTTVCHHHHARLRFTMMAARLMVVALQVASRTSTGIGG